MTSLLGPLCQALKIFPTPVRFTSTMSRNNVMIAVRNTTWVSQIALRDYRIRNRHKDFLDMTTHITYDESRSGCVNSLHGSLMISNLIIRCYNTGDIVLHICTLVE